MAYCRIHTNYENGNYSESITLRKEDAEKMVNFLNENIKNINDNIRNNSHSNIKKYSIQVLNKLSKKDYHDLYNFLISEGDASKNIAEILRSGNDELLLAIKNNNNIESIVPEYWEKKGEYYYALAKCEELKYSLNEYV